MVAGVVGSMLLAVVSGVSAVWSVQVLFDLLLTGYVTVLIRMRNLAAERELKLTFMPQAYMPEAAPRARRPQPAYDLGVSGYGDLDLRRAAN
jgi:hypothetical protein